MLRWIIFLFVYAALGFYTLQALKTATKYPWAQYLFVLIAVLVAGNFIYQFTVGEEQGRVLSRPKSYAFGFVLAVMAFQLITVLFLFSEDIFRLVAGGYNRISGNSTAFSLPQRRRFLSLLGLGIAALPFGALLYGMYKGKYNFKVLRYTMEYDDLPDAFDGYQITQISDVHSGSFDNRKKIEYAIDLVNQQKSDVLLFTGDMVNNKTEEMLPWKTLFSTLEAKDGKFSVLGNHDYGDYIEWETPEAKRANCRL